MPSGLNFINNNSSGRNHPKLGLPNEYTLIKSGLISKLKDDLGDNFIDILPSIYEKIKSKKFKKNCTLNTCKDLFYFRHDGHLTELGHQLILKHSIKSFGLRINYIFIVLNSFFKKFSIILLCIFNQVSKFKLIILFSISFILIFFTPKFINLITENCNKKTCVRYQNSIARSKVDKNQWNFQKERIESGWHVINKDVIDAKEFLNKYYDDKLYGINSGYLEEIDQNLLLIANGKGNIFLYSLLENNFKKVKSNLNQIYIEQKFEEISKTPGQNSIKDIFFDKKNNELYASLTKDINGNGCIGMAIYKASLKILISKIFKVKII